MSFDYVYNIESCFNFVNQEAPLSLVYYSHFITMVVALILGLFVLISNRKDLLSRLFFGITFVFSAWVTIDLITWISYNSQHYMFFWSFFGILTSLLYLLFIYFYYVFLNNKNVKNKYLFLFFILLLPVFIFTPTIYNLFGFENIDCISTESPLFTNYFHILGIFSFVTVIILFMLNYRKKESTDILKRKQSLIMFLGIESFIIIFFSATFLDSYLVLLGITGDYVLGNYGLFGMLIFLSIVAFLIVRFKAFEIKLLATQALVWAMVIMIGSQFFFIKSTVNMILNGITFLFMIIAGIMLVRSVKRVDEQRELLDMANKNQQSLLHFITHQVKGFMTKTRGIFSGILEGDFGDVNGKVREMVEYGLASETKGVETIQNILHASDLKSGTIEFIKKEFDLTTLVKGLIEDLRKKITDKGLEIEEYIQSKPIKFLGDELRIKEVCKNILDNAILYTDHGKITINLRQIDGKIIFSVKDSGIGLSESDKKDLFTEGGRGEESLAHNIDSTGYGLFIAKQIVKEHKGTIWAESQGRGKGSEFVVELPKI